MPEPTQGPFPSEAPLYSCQSAISERDVPQRVKLLFQSEDVLLKARGQDLGSPSFPLHHNGRVSKPEADTLPETVASCLSLSPTISSGHSLAHRPRFRVLFELAC